MIEWALENIWLVIILSAILKSVSVMLLVGGGYLIALSLIEAFWEGRDRGK